MKKLLITLLLLLPLTVSAIWWNPLTWDKPLEIVGAPPSGIRYERSLVPETDSFWDLGTSTLKWNHVYSDGLTVSALTDGSVLFSTSSGQISQDNANFYWDDADNRLGIGTEAPTHKLHVAENRADFVAVFRQTNANGAGIDVTVSGSGTNNNMLRISNAGGVNKFIIRNDGQVTMGLGGGDVGIGTTSPYARLSVVGQVVASDFVATSTTATHSLLVPQVGDATTPTIAFGDGDSGFYEQSDDSLRIAINGASKYVIDVNSIRVDRVNGAALSNKTPSATVPGLTFNADVDTGIGRAGADLLSLITAGTEALRIDASQNIGIGTTSPYRRLSVDGGDSDLGNNALAGYFTATSTTATSTFQATTTAPVFIGAITDDDGDTRIETEESSDEDVIRLYTNNAERLTVTNAGLVGIGGGVIGEMLHIENKNASGIATPIALLLSDSTLDSAGSAQITNLNLSTFIKGTANHTTNDSTAPRGIFSNFQITNTGTLNNAFGGDYKVFYNSAGTLTKGVAFRGQINNVGGGTITDGRAVDALITVVTPATFTKATGVAVEIQNTLGTITTGIGIDVHLNNILGTFTTATGINIRNSNNSGTWTTQYGIYINPLQGSTKYGIYQEGTEDNYFAGNIGIGTTSPYAKLSVEGEGVFEFLTATSTTATSTFQGGFAISSSATSTIAWGISIAEDGGVVGIGTTTPALSSMLGVAGDIYTSGTVRTENICGIGGSETAERSTISPNSRFAMGNGNTRNMTMACAGEITALAGECGNCSAGVTEVEIFLYKNNSQVATCGVGSLSNNTTGSSTPCTESFAVDDRITCGSGAEIGSASGVGCTFYYTFN